MNELTFLLVENEDKTIDLYCPETYGMDTWGMTSQDSLKKKNDKWYAHYWCDGGQWLDDINEDYELNVIFETQDKYELLNFVIQYYPNQLEEFEEKIKENEKSIKDWCGYFEKMDNDDLSLYERLCVGCEREKWCHENCEYCDAYEEALEEMNDE